MVKIEQLNAAKAVFTRNGNQQPAFLHAMLTDAEFETFKVLTGSVVVSIDESEIRTVYAEPVDIAASFTDKVNVETTEVVLEEKVKLAEKPATVVKPVPRARK